jgi:hypothetical protein
MACTCGLGLFRRYFLLNTTLPVLMCGYLALLVFSMNKASLEARIGALPQQLPSSGKHVNCRPCKPAQSHAPVSGPLSALIILVPPRNACIPAAPSDVWLGGQESR